MHGIRVGSLFVCCLIFKLLLLFSRLGFFKVPSAITAHYCLYKKITYTINTSSCQPAIFIIPQQIKHLSFCLSLLPIKWKRTVTLMDKTPEYFCSVKFQVISVLYESKLCFLSFLSILYLKHEIFCVQLFAKLV